MTFSSLAPLQSCRQAENGRVSATISLMLALFLVLSGCSTQHDPNRKAAETVVVKGATVETVSMAPLQDTLDVVGTVRARTSAMVSTRIPGIITVLKVREGDRVTKGQLLAKLDAQENQAAAAGAMAVIDEAGRGLDEALSRKKLADTTFDRYQHLFHEQAISRQEYDVKQTERELAAQGVARAESRLAQAQAGSRAASTMADYTRIVAPLSGVITVRQVDLGTTVFPGQPIMTIEDESSYQLELAIPESMTLQVKPGSPVQVALDSMDAHVTAKIAEIVPSADPASRTFSAKINLQQKGLKSGMFGRGAVSLTTSTSSLLIPLKAVVERGSLTSVWTLDKENIVRMRLIKVGKTVGTKVQVLAGLSAGERIVVGGIEKLAEGAKVE